ncbi:hypothetical protein HYC85_003987 [Camellia sinensis]|uniref:TRF2/HOY1 PH-like domain-containing protein n=1 Tax=Camellia sinensis TaxID=4442 RepID=A0A7J7HV74_CAMSI|nr:hypothetical protein HYC85_003987 [Camellia sinensis]
MHRINSPINGWSTARSMAQAARSTEDPAQRLGFDRLVNAAWSAAQADWADTQLRLFSYMTFSIIEKFSSGENEFPILTSQYNTLDEPSPLGLLQMRLAQGNVSSVTSAPSGNLSLRDRKDVKGTATSATTVKLKASNFRALLLRIGQWEEILEGGLKSKIEIRWLDIIALKANLPDDGPGSLTVTLTRPPHFFKETNPQPRKHALWQATAEFTDGQASMHRQHFLQCTQGLLNKHYEKLIQCDMHLNLVSRQPEMVLDSPYFDARGSVSKYPNKSEVQEVDQSATAKRYPSSGFQVVASPSTAVLLLED